VIQKGRGEHSSMKPDAGTFNEAPGREAAFDAADALVVNELLASRGRLGRPIVAGLCGAQGSGKSTMSARLARRLEAVGMPTAVLSLDDFYLTRAERAALGRSVHPLLKTRGVPGTHDLALARSTIASLVGKPELVAAPHFDKTLDDRAEPAAWQTHQAPVSVVILEGWCVGARPIPHDDLMQPINALERDEDAGGTWRRHVNAALQGDYHALFDSLDLSILLRAPDFACVHGWRLEQEMGLTRMDNNSMPAMDAPAVARFIAHYERLTRWIIADEPADLVIEIGSDRTPLNWRTGRGDRNAGRQLRQQ
jgi:D-glycerate 3-kinase